MADEDLMMSPREAVLLERFVKKKGRWIGGELQDLGDPLDRLISGGKPAATPIVDITMEPGADGESVFRVVGQDFLCGFAVSWGHLNPPLDDEWVRFTTKAGHLFRIRRPS